MPADNAQLSGQSVQAGTTETAGATFPEVVTMTNSGTTTWLPGASGYTLNLVGTDSLGAVPLSPNSTTYFHPYATINSGSSVPQEGTATFSMDFIAPETVGTYYRHLSDEQRERRVVRPPGKCRLSSRKPGQPASTTGRKLSRMQTTMPLTYAATDTSGRVHPPIVTLVHSRRFRQAQ